jgi:hypothetical protein
MSLSYDEILTEVRIFSKPYSQAHLTFSKWRSYQTKIFPPPESEFSIHEIEGQTFALIYRPSLTSIEAFQFDTIVKRTYIKRNELVFNAIRSLWQLLNPFHLPGISKQTYIKFYEFTHFSVLNPNAQLEVYSEVQQKDADLDFASCDSQPFTQFYDTVFENIDAYAKSSLISEYCRIIKRVHTAIKSSAWIKSLDLHNKVHSEGAKPSFPSWAAGHVKSRSIESQYQPVRPLLLTPNVPLRLTERKEKRERSSDGFEARLQKLTSPWHGKEKWEHRTATAIKKVENKEKKRIKNEIGLGKVDQNMRMLGKKLKGFKDRRIIEEIVNDRQSKMIGNKQRVLMTPLKFLF